MHKTRWIIGLQLKKIIQHVQIQVLLGALNLISMWLLAFYYIIILRIKYNMLQIIFRICLWYAHNFNTKRKFEVLCTLNILWKVHTIHSSFHFFWRQQFRQSILLQIATYCLVECLFVLFLRKDWQRQFWIIIQLHILCALYFERGDGQQNFNFHSFCSKHVLVKIIQVWTYIKNIVYEYIWPLLTLLRSSPL